MMERLRFCLATVAALLLACSGCARAPGVPSASVESVRPDKQLDFHALYKQNCSGCHGENGRGGAAIALNNSAYLAVAGAQNLRTATAKGMNGTNMPAFAASSGGMLTDAQVDSLVQGMLREWSRSSDFAGVAIPPYSATTPGNTGDGAKAYGAACARCHGADGTGVQTSSGANAKQGATAHSIVDASYLALVSDQNLRSYVIAGHLDDNAPDWRSYIPGRALTSQEITDIVAWIAAHRVPTPQESLNRLRANPSAVAAKEKP